MNKIITLKNLVELIARRSGTDLAASDAFLKAYTNLIRECLVAGEPVAVKGVGEFSVDKATKKVLFAPDAELAESVNAPFAMFMPEEVAPAVTIDELHSVPAAPEAKPEPVAEPAPVAPVVESAGSEPEIAEPAKEDPKPVEAPAVEVGEEVAVPPYNPQPVVEPEPEPVVESEPEPVAEPEYQTVVESEPEPVSAPSYERYDENEADEDEAEDETEEEKASLPFFWISVSLIAGAIIGLLIGFFLHDPIMKKLAPSLNVEEQVEEVAEPEDEIVEEVPEPEATPEAVKEEAPAAEQPKAQEQPAVAEKKEAEPVYDTIETTLSNLARKHYHHAEYWVYICKENNIKNPNQVQKGQRVVIPPIEKYATAATEAENLQNARNEGKRLEDAAKRK